MDTVKDDEDDDEDDDDEEEKEELNNLHVILLCLSVLAYSVGRREITGIQYN